MATRGFTGRGRGTQAQAGRLPPGQYLTTDFPVLSAGPTPHVAREDWRFDLKVGPRPVKTWNWSDFIRLNRSLARSLFGETVNVRSHSGCLRTCRPPAFPHSPVLSWRPCTIAVRRW